jgi:hypothetical protein
MRVVQGKPEAVREVHGAGIKDELSQVCLVLMEVGPDDGTLELSKELSNFWKDFSSGGVSGVAFADDVSDVVPDSGTDTAVTGDREGGSGSTLDGQSAICQVILAKHLHMNPEFLDLICGEDTF